MARIEIKTADCFIFETQFTVRVSDLNYGNHVGNDAFVSLIHEARVRFLKSLGYSEMDVEGKAIIMADLSVVYKSQSYYGDRLKFELGAADFNKYGCDIFYRATNPETEKLVFEAKTGIVFFDYAKNKVCTIPEKFLKHFGRPD